MAAEDHTDILLDENYDTIIENGDIKVGPSIEQEGKLIEEYHQGTLRSDGLVGVGLSDWLNADVDPSGLASLDRRIQQQMEMDGKNAAVEYVLSADQELLAVNTEIEQS